MRPRLPFGNNKNTISSTSDPIIDSTAWLINSGFAEFLLLHTIHIKYMVMFGYTYLNGCKLFGTLPPNSSMAYKYISMILQCTGGGILVPLILNSIPVPIGQDSYPIMITISFLLHYYFPILRDVTHQSSILYGIMIVLYEIMRSYVVVKFITLANNTIPPSDFTIPIFGPIFCGTIAGCGAAFVPFNKGLDAIKISISTPMISACIASIFYHCIVNSGSTILQPNAADKAHVLITIYFIAYHLSTDFHHVKSIPTTSSTSSSTSTTSTGNGKKEL